MIDRGRWLSGPGLFRTGRTTAILNGSGSYVFQLTGELLHLR